VRTPFDGSFKTNHPKPEMGRGGARLRAHLRPTTVRDLFDEPIDIVSRELLPRNVPAGPDFAQNLLGRLWIQCQVHDW